MKPSEKIVKIREKLNKEGHTVGSAYYLEAILQYLDEEWEKNKIDECQECKDRNEMGE